MSENKATSKALAPVKRTAGRLKSEVTRERLLHAAKIMLAVGIAWRIARHLPGVADNYPYYAPLGAIVSMYPTLMGSIKNARQTLGSLTVAIAISGAVIIFSSPNVITMSLAVGIRALIAATGWFGANREYIPVTVLIFPTLSHRAVDQQLANFRRVLSGHLVEISEALAESWPPERDGWASEKDTLISVSGEVRAAVLLAEESRKANPRARRHRRDMGADYDDLSAIENTTFHVRNITDVLTGAVWGTPIKVELRPEMRPPLSTALAAVATLLHDWDSAEKRQPKYDNAVMSLEVHLLRCAPSARVLSRRGHHRARFPRRCAAAM